MGKSTLEIKATSLVYNNSLNELYKDNVFIDDKYLEDFDINKAQISVDSHTNDVLYALSSGFDVQVDNLASNKFSFMNVLHENYDDLKNDQISMQIRMREIGVTIDSAKEFITKVNAAKELEGDNNISFAGILFSSNKASILNTGNARIFLFRDKYLKLISAHPELPEDIIKDGALNIESINSNSDKDNNTSFLHENSKVLSENFDVKAGDIYVLCNEGSYGLISDDSIYEQLSQKVDINQAVSYLVKEGIAGSENKNISMIAIEIKTIPTDVIFSGIPVIAGASAVAGAAVISKTALEKNVIMDELLGNDNDKLQDYTGTGVPFIGANRNISNNYEKYGNEKEAKLNKNMVAGVIALSLVLVALLIMSGIMIYSFSKGESTYEGIIVTSQPTTEVMIRPATPTAKPNTTAVPTPSPSATAKVATPTVKPKATPKPTAKPTIAPTEAPTTEVPALTPIPT